MLTELQAEIPGVVARYAECVASTADYPKPFELPCHPYSGLSDQQPAYGVLNLLGYVATGESEAAETASGECADALATSSGESLSGWALQETIKALNDSFVVGYPDIAARLRTVTDALNGKSEAVTAVLAAC